MTERRSEWHRYYAERRVRHQAKQLEMVGALDAPDPILEIGPAYGFVTALLVNAGYTVTTLDLTEPNFSQPAVPHIQVDLTTVTPEDVAGFRTCLCCETLEHLHWDQAGHVLRTLREAGTETLITSVPYEAIQVYFEIYFNGMSLKQRSQFKKGRSLKAFKPDGDPLGHKWEIGYKETPLKAWEALIEASGWRIAKRDFISPTRSVFHRMEAP